MTQVTRFAPSPTGYLHLGHAASAIFAQEASKGGRFILRIEDIDPVRCKPEFAEAIVEDLSWLGLNWEQTVRKQSEHMKDYAAALDQLRGLGVLYPCFCTRSQIAEEVARAGQAPHGPEEVLYPGTCRHSSPQQQADRLQRHKTANWRLDMEKAMRMAGTLTWRDRSHGAVLAMPEKFGDVVLARKDVPTSYHLSVTVDDHLQGVTLVTRGEDLFRATDIHRLLQALLGYAVPDYHHHPLMRDESGRRFAKRDQSVTLRALRAEGATPGGVRDMVKSILIVNPKSC